MSWVRQIARHRLVGSTMDEARRWADAGAPHGSTLQARGQTAARGRHGRAWLAPTDAGVYLTTILRPAPQPGLERLSLVSAAAVYEALSACGARVQLKWPNDVVAGPCKLAGILLEAQDLGSSAPRIFVGVGINLAPAATLEWPKDLRAPAIGLADLLGAMPDGNTVADAVVERLEAHVFSWERHGLRDALALWRRADALLGHTVQVSADHPLTGKAQGIADDGQLVVRGPLGLTHVSAGEVSKVRAVNALHERCPARGAADAR